MGFDDRATDRKSHAHPIWLCRIEWFEQTLQRLRAQARTSILHSDAQAVLGALGRDHQVALAVSNIVGRLDAVDDQVQHHLLQLHPIGMNARQGKAQAACAP